MDSHHHNKNPSASDLLSNAKVVAEAARSAIHRDTEKIDRAKVSGAAENLLSAASHYGKFEEKKFGKYVEKAEVYLHQYNSSHSATATTTVGHVKPAGGHSAAAGATHTGGGGGSSSGGGIGDYMKLAEGFLKKH